MTWQEGMFEAVVTADTPLGAEFGPIRGAELSRHAAIAGLCAAALTQSDDRRRYYLAQEATYEGYACAAAFGARIVLRAEIVSLDKREAWARIVATCDGHRLAQLDVRYTILTEAAFERLFRTRYVADLPVSRGEPFVLPEGAIVREGETLVRRLPHVPVEACAGHFDHYPAMPVAILMGQLAELAGRCLEGSPFYVTQASVQAHDLCWAGESVDFMVRPESAEDDTVSFTCSALASGRATGQMQLTLRRLPRS